MVDGKPLRLVVPFDGSQLASQAIPFAQALAAPPAEIVLVDVLHSAEPERSLLGSVTADAETVMHRHERAALSALEAEADRIRVDTPWISVVATTAVGTPVEGIRRVAHEQRADFVVIAHGHRSLVGRLALGSVTDGLIKSGDVSVLVVRSHDGPQNLAPSRVDRLVLPLDGSPTAERAVPVAKRLALHAGLPVHIVTVAKSPDIPMLEGIVRPRADLDASGIHVTVEFLTGNPERAIEHALRPTDLVVIGSHHGTGVAAWLARGVTERLIERAPCPVLVVRDGANAQPTSA